MLPLFLHVDMDAFFASVEMRSDPRLRGKALVVGGGPGGRGVVTTASYPARKYGVHSGMAMVHALRLCPHLLALPVNSSKYVYESLAVLSVLDRISPRVEAASIDEAYLEMEPGSGGTWNARARYWGHIVQETVRRERGLPCSVGAAINKLQAKMASALGKPEGVTVLPPGEFLRVFGEQPVSVIPGVGPRTTETLAGLGVRTVGDLATAPPESLRPGFGKWGNALRDQARGRDERVLFATGEEPTPRSASHETTFGRDVSDPDTLRATIWLLSDRVARRLRHHGYTARTVGVRFKVGQRRYSRQRAMGKPTDEPRSMAVTAWSLLETARRGRPLRLVGVVGMRLVRSEGESLLFPGDRKRRVIMDTEDRLRDRFGERTILPGGVFRGRGKR